MENQHMTFEAGQAFSGRPPFGGMSDVYKMHVVQIIDEGQDVIKEPDHIRRMVVYRVYGLTKQWWHYFICTSFEFQSYIERGKL